ncbi:hypothetical protein Misp01_24630 [Microtetraspora sp. NBRC 13810]|nr:hypothetical protein Misp01_24630 [Microtetraspora sp. NBRC 13810]
MRQHGVVEADDPGEPRLAGTQPGQQVLTDLSLHRAVDMTALAQLTQSVELWDLMHGFETTSPGGNPAARLAHSPSRPQTTDPDDCVTIGVRVCPHSGENRAKGTAHIGG